MKLNLGCGTKPLAGWENLDLKCNLGVKYCDLRKPLPYPNNSTDFIYHEHFLEHLDEVDGFHLLQECYRVLKPDGWMRCVTPDLKKYVASYLNWNQAEYKFDNFTDGCNFLNYAILGEAVTGIKYLSPVKNSVNVGHLYLYDFQDLSNKLSRIGFTNLRESLHGWSCLPEFDKKETRMPSREIVLEAMKP